MDTLYQDQDMKIFLEGKKVIITSAEMTKLEFFSEEVFVKMGLVSTLCSAILFETLGAQGTNILMQDMEQFKIIIVPRSQDDGINFMWEPKNLDEGTIKDMKSKISSALDNPVKPKEVKKEEPEEIEVISDSPMEELKEEKVEEKAEEVPAEEPEEKEASEESEEKPAPEEKKEATKEEDEYTEEGYRVIKQNPIIRQLKRMP